MVSETFNKLPQNGSTEDLIRFVYGCVLKGPLERGFISQMLTPDDEISKTEDFVRSQTFDYPPSITYSLIANAADALEDWPHRYFNLVSRVNCMRGAGLHEAEINLPLIPRVTGNWPYEGIPFVSRAYEEYEKNAAPHQATYLAVRHAPRLQKLAKTDIATEDAARVSKTDILKYVGNIPATLMTQKGPAIAQAKVLISQLRRLGDGSCSFRESCRALGMHPRILARMSTQAMIVPYLISTSNGPEDEVPVWKYSPRALRDIMEAVWSQLHPLGENVPGDLISMDECYRILRASNVEPDGLLLNLVGEEQKYYYWFRVDLYAPYLQPDKFSEVLVSRRKVEKVAITIARKAGQ